MMTDDTLKDLAARLHAAHQELDGENNREDQRLIEEAARLAELAQSAAQRIEARAVEVEAAEAAMLAYGLENANVRFDQAFEPEPALENIYPQAVAASGWQVEEPQPYSNGLDGHNEE